ncbi:MAG: PAS domain S-box protein [Candidatus Aminicenantales bacterium]
MRKSGIGIVGNVSWGSHICLFYESEFDLLDILIPYFKSGLESNEYCLWITNEPLTVEKARDAIKARINKFDEYERKGQVEIVEAESWYKSSGIFEADVVLEAWARKEYHALKAGFDGLRCAGDTSWLKRKDWKRFLEYEARAHTTNGRYRMLTICSYPLTRCRVERVFDLVNYHKLALLKRKNKWILIEGSENKKAETLLRESEQRWRFIVQNTPDIFLTVSSSGKILSTNRAVLNIVKREITGKKIYDFIAPEYNSVLKKALDNVFKKGESKNCILFGTGSRGPRTAWYETMIVPIKHKGNVMASTLILRDITRQKRAEDAFSEANERLKTIIENINDIIFQLTPQGMITYVSPRTKELSGFNPQELIGKHLKCITPEEEVPKALKALKEVASGNSLRNFEITLFDARKKPVPVEINISPVRVNGKITAVQGVIRNIKERREAEKKLQIERAYLNKLFEECMMAIVMADKKGKIIKTNNEFNRMFGYKPEEVHGQPLDKLVVPRNSYRRALSITKRVARGERLSFRAVRCRKDGSRINVRVLASPIIVGGKLKAIYGIYQLENNISQPQLHQPRRECVSG